MSFGPYNTEKADAAMVGDLRKSGALTNRGVTREYICKRGFLIYYETVNDPKPKKVIELKGAQVDAFPGPAENGFVLRTVHRTHTLFAKSPENVTAWIQAVRSEANPSGATHVDKPAKPTKASSKSSSKRKSEEQSTQASGHHHHHHSSAAKEKNYTRTANRVEDLYDITEELGSGGFSVVKRGICKTDGTEWALKMIKQSVFVKNKERTEEEVEVLARLSHPNIVHFREVVRTPKFYVIVMEILEGGELFDRIVEREKYDEAHARAITVKILNSVKYLHDNNVVHRDLKPENLLFDTRAENAELKLTDFGFATMAKKNLTDTCGTPEYVAPEILDEKPYSYKVDMWSVGVIVYILLCGFPPFHGKDDQDLFDKICECRYEFVKPYWNRVSEDAKQFIRKLLCLDPDARMSADEALRHPWLTRGRRGSAVENADLSSAVQELKRYNATRKFRKAVLAVLAANRIRTLMRTIKQEAERKK
eukprot:c9211_g1_i1.p1 GENE.c9211_g1_i1~~c9211_g1_i1.p1  ORF type:complete len:479 (-),score=105.58 c9211_g1_i1:89-1525(-)